MAGFDVPKLGGYQMVNPPTTMSIIPEVVQQVNELADGGTKQRILGYRYHANMEWSDNWIRTQDLTGLMAVANDASATLSFVPRPVTYPTRTYVVVWLNKFQFSFKNGRYGLYSGQIELMTPTTTSTINDLP